MAFRQLLARSEESGAHGADWALEDFCCRFVRHIEQLGQNKRLELRSSQPCQKIGSEARLHTLRVADPRGEPLDETSVSLPEPDVISTHVAADPQQPRKHTSVPSERAQRANRPEVGLLYQVLDIAFGPQGVAQLPDVGFGQSDELDQGRIISLDRTRHHLAKDPVRGHLKIIPDGGGE